MTVQIGGPAARELWAGFRCPVTVRGVSYDSAHTALAAFGRPGPQEFKEVVAAKLRSPRVREALLETGDEALVDETDPANRMGRVLMAFRRGLVAARPEAITCRVTAPADLDGVREAVAAAPGSRPLQIRVRTARAEVLIRTAVAVDTLRFVRQRGAHNRFE